MTISQAHLHLPSLLASFSRLNVLVVGDICLDRWCQYDPAFSEPSRETGIPRIAVSRFESTAGAAGTIANNLSDLGVGRVSVMGVVGEDSHGDELFAALARRSIGTDLVLRSPLVQTFTYTKHINTHTGVEDLPRVDFINTTPLPATIDEQLRQHLDLYAPAFDAILVLDQAETDLGGIVTPLLRDGINQLAAASEHPLVWVDSRRRAEHFRHCFLKPNLQELEEAAARLRLPADIASLRQHLDLRALIVTEGERGARFADAQGLGHAPAVPVGPPVDICGAGDSFSAGAASALSVGAPLAQAVALGNLVASITVMKKGTGTATPSELLAAAAKHPSIGLPL